MYQEQCATNAGWTMCNCRVAGNFPVMVPARYVRLYRDQFPQQWMDKYTTG